MNGSAQELNRQLDRRAAEVVALSRLWKSVFTSVLCPSAAQFGWWLSSHAFELVSFAITQTADKAHRMFETEGEEMTADHAIRFCSKVALSNTRSLIPRKPSYTERVVPL